LQLSLEQRIASVREHPAEGGLTGVLKFFWGIQALEIQDAVK